MNILSELPEVLINEKGAPPVGVCIWREDRSVDVAFQGTLGEFLSKPENQSGEWFVDGGWGGPPGPIKVIWVANHWENRGFPPWERSPGMKYDSPKGLR